MIMHCWLYPHSQLGLRLVHTRQPLASRVPFAWRLWCKWRLPTSMAEKTERDEKSVGVTKRSKTKQNAP